MIFYEKFINVWVSPSLPLIGVLDAVLIEVIGGGLAEVTEVEDFPVIGEIVRVGVG